MKIIIIKKLDYFLMKIFKFDLNKIEIKKIIIIIIILQI